MNIEKRDKIAGAIYGFAIGDAIGATTEFLTAEQIKKMYGQVDDIIGGGWLQLEPGEVTDDTQMTICVIEAFMRHHGDIDSFVFNCKRNFIRWYLSKPNDIGGQCLRAIKAMINNHSTPVDDQALGNGSLMRAMPMAIFDLPFYNVTQGRLTHNNSLCTRIIIEYTKLIQGHIENNSSKVYTNSRSFCYDLLEPTGHVVNTFNNAIYWSRKDSFEEAIIGAVNHGGDADTIAAITGSIAGAKFGYSAIPEQWIDKLNPNVKNILENFKIFAFNCLQI